MYSVSSTPFVFPQLQEWWSMFAMRLAPSREVLKTPYRYPQVNLRSKWFSVGSNLFKSSLTHENSMKILLQSHEKSPIHEPQFTMPGTYRSSGPFLGGSCSGRWGLIFGVRSSWASPWFAKGTVLVGDDWNMTGLFSISYMGCHPSKIDELIRTPWFFRMGLLHHQPEYIGK